MIYSFKNVTLFLGDGSKALMLVHISPTEDDVGETICSLNFAIRARAVESNRELPEDLKQQRGKRLAELDQQMRDAEEEHQKIRKDIQAAEFLLQEKKKLFSMTYKLPEDPQERTSPRVDQRECRESPRTAEKSVGKSISSSLPRFMTSTACSRQRQGINVEISGRAKTPRLGGRNLNELFGSQSLSYSGPYFKANLRSSMIGKTTTHDTKKYGYGEPNAFHADNLKCKTLNWRTSSIPHNKRVSMSHTNLRVATSHHRRRMSDFG